MLFGTSGIRGIYGKDITKELAYKVAYVFADQAVVIGRDTRSSGSTLEQACKTGIIKREKEYYLLGVVPTPTVALAVAKGDKLGIMVTASHNPEEYNGLKLFRNGKEISRIEEQEFEKRFNKTDVDLKGLEEKQYQLPEPGYMPPEANHAIELHKSMIKKLIDTDAIAKRKPKVIVDCNGAAATITPYLMRELGCQAISVNSEIGGFNRPSEPNAENLRETAKIVKATGADLGVAHDGDGDRCVVIDETGAVLPLDVQLAMMIEYELKNSKEKKPIIISTVEASLMIREVCKRNDSEIKITPVSSVYISEELEKLRALFGGEPCGEYIFGNAMHHAPDGVLAAAKFVEMFIKLGKLSQLRKKYKTYPMLREKFKCEKKNKYGVINEIIKKIDIIGEKNTEDGLRIDEDDGWFLIRASGTEPIIRLTIEYKHKNKLDKRADELKEIIKSNI